MDDAPFEHWLVSRLEQFELSQADFRRLLERHSVTVHPTTVSKWIHGKRAPSHGHLSVIMDLLGVVQPKQREHVRSKRDALAGQLAA